MTPIDRSRSWHRLNLARQLIITCLVVAYTVGPASAALAIGVDHTPIPAKYHVGVRITAALFAVALLLGSLWDWSRLVEVTARRDKEAEPTPVPDAGYRLPIDVI